MKKRIFLLLVLTIAVGWAAQAQRVVHLNGHSFVPDQNIGQRVRGAIDLGESVNGQHTVLVQFAQLPDAQARRRLEAQGITLQQYIGGNAYYALMRAGAGTVARMRGGDLTSLMALQPEWKVVPALASGKIPSHAQVAPQTARLEVRFFAHVEQEQALRDLQNLGMRSVRINAKFGKAVGILPVDRVGQLSRLPWVAYVGFEPAPMRTTNREGLALSKGNILQLPAQLHGRGLTGKGVRVGIWDENVYPHPDFGNRVTIEEFEFPPQDGANSHGTHVAGTVLGSGLLNADALGMAPKASAWTYNFNVQSNGLQPTEEMDEAYAKHKIQITQNS